VVSAVQCSSRSGVLWREQQVGSVVEGAAGVQCCGGRSRSQVLWMEQQDWSVVERAGVKCCRESRSKVLWREQEWSVVEGAGVECCGGGRSRGDRRRQYALLLPRPVAHPPVCNTEHLLHTRWPSLGPKSKNCPSLATVLGRFWVTRMAFTHCYKTFI
jgi:hypothetical protein